MGGWDGTLSADEFRRACLYLVDVWATHCSDLPPWRWQSFPVHPFVALDTPEGYLVLEDVFVEGTQQSEQWPSCEAGFNHEDSGSIDLATVVPPLTTKGYFYTYHITYSEVFRVPKLFLKGRLPDGQPLQWQDLQQLLPAGLADEGTKWTFLTYEEHPSLRMPWLALHPCGTSSLMSIVFSQCGVGHTSLIGNMSAKSSLKNGSILEHNKGKKMSCYQSLADMGPASVPMMNGYIMTWFSFASQAVALKLPKGFLNCFTEVQNSDSPASDYCPQASYV